MTEELKKKLQFKPEMKVAVLNSPDGLEYAEVSQIQQDTNAVLQFAINSKQLKGKILLQSENAVVWVAYPKKASGIETDLSRETGWTLFEKAGWLPVRQVAIDDNWSALRFRPKSDIKKLKRNTDYPGIDRVKKTVEIPEDFKEALMNSSALEKFETLAFSHRKEYVISILDAKKTETRARRIEKNVEMIREI